MSSFGRHWRTISGAVVGFSAGAGASALLLRHFDSPVDTAAAAAPTAPTAATGQLLSERVPTGEVQPGTFEATERPLPRYGDAIRACRNLVLQTKEELGIPGVCVAVNVNGVPVWAEGFGLADVENAVPCTPKTTMRIASISKSITMAALAKLWENGKVDLDQPVQRYVPDFPNKTFEGEPVEITTRMLVSHLSGIRHWKGGEEKNAHTAEFYLNTNFESVEDALSIFKDDDLEYKPGTEFAYSSPAWTLVSAVMEKAAGVTYSDLMADLFHELGLKYTRLDLNDRITSNRARYYVRNANGRLKNSPCVNNSCKWAGGGLQATVGDLVKFGDAMLYCYQGGPSGYLKKDSIDALWTMVPKTINHNTGYGMGWCVIPQLTLHGGVQPQRFAAYHTGGAVGASSILLITPQESRENYLSGTTVAIIVNMQDCGLTRLATEISECFTKV